MAEITWLGYPLGDNSAERALGWDILVEITWLRSIGWDILFEITWLRSLGWDILVDGQPFQVKCLADPSGLEEHFKNYPEIPVFANSELAGDISEESSKGKNPWDISHLDEKQNAMEEGDVHQNLEYRNCPIRKFFRHFLIPK